MKSNDIRNQELDGKPAPDIIRYEVLFDENGSITSKFEVYTENTYSQGFAIKLGKKEGNLSKTRTKTNLCGSDLSWRYIEKEPAVQNVNQKHFGLISPDQPITAGGWGYLEDKEVLLTKAKEAIKGEFVKLIDLSKGRLIQLMHPEIAKDNAVTKNADSNSEPGM